jgi:transcriptional regulator with XRE-family HTH domain
LISALRHKKQALKSPAEWAAIKAIDIINLLGFKVCFFSEKTHFVTESIIIIQKLVSEQVTTGAVSMESFNGEATSIDVGLHLKKLREARGVSMRALARSSGLSANALSMIERGLTSPSVSTLNKLAGALQVPITAFFRQEIPRQKVVFRKAAERSRISFNKGLWEGLGGELFTGRMEAFLLTLESGGSSGQHSMLHTGHELVFCLRGGLEYEVEDQHFLLEPGDSLIFHANMPHRWRNHGSKVTNAIIVIAGFGENDRPGDLHPISEDLAEDVLPGELSGYEGDVDV